ncbi:MAG: CBS domain-containing protein [Pirellulaceae bacterium]|nr:CBS domain-containing protein [Pirellulaceae bacterium]
MSVGRICVRSVDLAEADEPVQVAAQRMNDRNVGTLVVLDNQRRPIGIVTDRDLALRVVAKGLAPLGTTVGQVMTECPETVGEDTSIEAALTVMRAGPYRRVPVVDDDGRLVGLVSVDDVLDLLAEEFSEIRQLLARENPSVLGVPG